MPQMETFFRFNWFAAILLVGVVQGFFLGLLFLSKRPHRQPYHHLLLAGLVFSFSLLVLEIFLCYAGIMFHTLSLVDFSEPLNFAVGPLSFLLLRSFAGRRWKPKQWLHFLPLLLYFLYHLLFMMQPIAVKYNAYQAAYFPEATQLSLGDYTYPGALLFREYVNELTLVHITVYIGLCFWLLKRPQQGTQPSPYFASWTRLFLYFYAATLFLFLFIKLAFDRDLGDHFLATFLVVQLYLISYKVMLGSSFFQPVVQVKYEKSALSEEAKQDLLQKLKAAEEARFYTQPSASLPSLAKQLHTSPHYLSQSLNECLGKSFFEYLAELRIQQAKAILADAASQHLKVEEVGEQVGYMSKSAFSAAFKKYTGLTPGQYRKNAFSGAV